VSAVVDRVAGETTRIGTRCGVGILAMDHGENGKEEEELHILWM